MLVPTLACGTDGTTKDRDTPHSHGVMMNGGAGGQTGSQVPAAPQPLTLPPGKTIHDHNGRELRVLIERLPERDDLQGEDLLGRVLRKKDSEEDCVRAETSQILGEAEVRRRVEDRRDELALSCGLTDGVGHPDVSSTPRHLGAATDMMPPEMHSGPGQGTQGHPLYQDVDDREVLRSGRHSDQWNVSLEPDQDMHDEEAGAAGMAEAAPNPHGRDAGLQLDPAGLNALTETLRSGITQEQAGPNHQPPVRTSSPNDKNQNAGPIPDDDDPMDFENTLNTSRKRTRGGSKHGKTDTTSVSCLLYTSPSPRDRQKSRMPSSA